ncbi:MAG: DUF1214 domain-containing protein [Chitinophagaceae bacterium]|nr:DUF1214 domain-containing protein [Chitinophagaceae bacterium]
MGKFIFKIFGIIKWFRLSWLRLTGKTEADMHAQRIVSGKAWSEFCDHLKTAGAALVYPGAPVDPFQQAEGVRYLSRLTRAALEAYVEYGDVEFPELRRMVHETVKLGADNPDNYYQNAQISGAQEYRITGKRNTINYIGFFTQNGVYGEPGGMSPCGILENNDLQLETDGSFEIILSKTKKGKNWLKLEDRTSLLIVRQTFLDREHEMIASLKIENLNGKKYPNEVTPEKIDKGLQTAALFVAGAPVLFARWANGFQKHPNKLPRFSPAISNAAGGDANIVYYHSYWKLKPNEALVITFTPPDCETWNFQLNNYWMESLDYRYFPICVNKHSATKENDGSIRIIVSKTNPGFSNWIDTCNHFEGTMCLRWYRLRNGAEPIDPLCTVSELSELKK